MTVSRMKLLTMQYLGFTAMDRRFSGPMLPWIVSEIRKRDSYEQVSLGVEDGCVQAYNQDFELQWSHRLQQVTRFSQVEPDPCCFLYLYRDDQEQLLYCYLFQAVKHSDVADLYQQMREQVGQSPAQPQRSLSSAANLTSLCVDISPSSSHFFEVLYVGKIKISHRKVPESFIDDALDKFKTHEAEKGHRTRNNTISSECSDGDDRRGSVDSTTSEATLSLDVPSCAATPVAETPTGAQVAPAAAIGTEVPEQTKAPKAEEEPKYDHNRTMVLQVGRSDLRLISPDRKLILLHKQHRDVASCVQGIRNPQHFGFICKEQQSSPSSTTSQQTLWYIGYVFKCESTSVVADAVNAISQAFTNPETSRAPHSRSPPHLTSCEHCPMIWYHRLCAEVENMSERKTQAAIFRRIDQLDEEEQSSIVTKFKGAETDSIREQNEFLMMLLRAHCEMKQMRHIHDTAENRSEFLNQYLGGSTIFMKAKRSLSNSFDHLLKRKGSRDDVNVAGGRADMTLPVTGHTSGRELLVTPECAGEETPSGSRTRSISTGNSRGLSPDHPDKNPKSPMMDIFMKVGSSPRASQCEELSPVAHRSTPNASWRQAIFNRVSTPAKAASERAAGGTAGGGGRSREELRELWRRAIKQAILLVRMERENARLRARQEETAVKRIKLEYDEMMGVGECSELAEVWDSLLSHRDSYRLADDQLLMQAIRRGVPRSKRGEVWYFLAEQQCLRHSPPAKPPPNYNTPYVELLRQLTSHQHAILIDLGRTFPQHPYFSSPLGPGQLALFNLLKAYSLLDGEVGYCQGLSFVAGVLLLHMDEAEAYRLLKHVMFSRGLRAQYLPDMAALQVQLYQLSRLLHDRLPELYAHLDEHEVAPTLYAAPWLLTLFASQFPLGFVTRVFDLLFLEGGDVLFKVALALMSEHSARLLELDSFEEIMEYLKTSLPAVDGRQLDTLMKQVFHMGDVPRQLHEYKVEYQVLQEEMANVRPQLDQLHRLESEVVGLHDQNKQLVSQLELALQNVQRLERNRTLQQSHMNRLEMQARGLEVSVATLGAFIDTLVENKVDVEIPGEVRRIVSQLMVAERRRIHQQQQSHSSGNLLARTISSGTHMFRNKSQLPGPQDRHQMVKSLSTGRIGLTSGENLSVPRSNSLNSGAELRQELLLEAASSGGGGKELPGLRVISDDAPPQQAATKPTSLGTKMSTFFSSSHSNILHNRLGGSGAQQEHSHPPAQQTIKSIIREDSRENLLSPTPESGVEEPAFPATATAPSQSTIGEGERESPTGSVDSGVGTPLSPSQPTGAHPLSNCDVNITYNGTTKLKNIRAMTRNMSRNSSPDLLGK